MATTGTIMTVRRLAAIAGLAVAGVTVGQGAPSAQAQAAPPVVTIEAQDGQVTIAGDCDGGSETTIVNAVFTLTRTGDTSEELFVDTARTGSLTAVANAVEGITIPAGETTATYSPDTGDAAGTIGYTIAATTFPGSFVVGTPGAAETQVHLIIADPYCPTTSTSTPATEPPPTPGAAPPAEAVAGTADYTG